MYSKEDLDKVVNAMETMIGVLLPDSEVGPKVAVLWRAAMDFAETVEEVVPDNEERDAALTMLSEVLRKCSEGIMREFDTAAAKNE